MHDENISLNQLIKLTGYKTQNKQVLHNSTFAYIVDKLLPKFADYLEEQNTFYDIAHIRFDTSLANRIWHQTVVSYETHIEQLALLSFHKQINPTTFDTWKYIDFQYWFKKFIEIGEKENKKNQDEQENAKIEQGAMLSRAKGFTKSSVSSAKMPRMKMPKLR